MNLLVAPIIDLSEAILEELGLKLDEAAGEYYYDEITVKRSVLGDGGASGNCELCDDCAGQEWIDMDDVFLSGEDEPPHHPNCTCSVEYKDTRKRVYV